VLTITGGGARFNLGPDANLNNQVVLGIRNVNTTNLGSRTTAFINTLASGGANNLLTGDINTAQQAVNAAIDQISGLRGRLGAFQKNTFGATIRTLGVSLENISAAESSIRDTDFAEATAELACNQILVQAASSMLNISNAQSQNVLFLLQ
jgi:flagellin